MNDIPDEHWDEATSQRFIDYGRYFVPGRETQMQIMVDLLKALPEPLSILELCCGEGLLAEKLLDALPGASYLGLDGSRVMLGKASGRLSRFGARQELAGFELADTSWRQQEERYGAIVSSLAIHHLDGAGKQVLYADLFNLIREGGTLVIADMVEPATPASRAVAADAWDEAVRQRSLDLDGTTAGFEFFVREGWNTYRYSYLDDIDHPSPLFDQLKWLEAAGFVDIDVHILHAGHAVFSGWKPRKKK